MERQRASSADLAIGDLTLLWQGQITQRVPACCEPVTEEWRSCRTLHGSAESLAFRASPAREPLPRTTLALSMSDAPANEAPYRMIRDVEFGADVNVYSFTNLYGCSVGDGSRIGTFVEIQAGAAIGGNCKVSSHTFVCEGVTI